MPADPVAGPPGWHGPDGVARRTSPRTVLVAGASIVFGAIAWRVGALVQDAIVATTSTADSDPSNTPFGLLVVGLFLVGGGILQAIRWATTTYAVLPTELVVDSGLLNREHRVFPFARIQQADTHQNLIGQLLRLTELKIDVAGASGSTQLRLRLLDGTTAVALRDHILRRRAELHAAEGRLAEHPPGDGAGPAAPTTSTRVAVGSLAIGTEVGAGEREVLRIAPGRIALGASTQSAIVLTVPIVTIAALWLAAFLAVGESNRLGGAAVAGGAVVIVLAIAFLVVVSSVITHHGFVVSLAGDDIHLRYGLIDTRNLTVPRRRVQQVTILDNPLRRRLGLVELHLHTAAAPGGEGTTRFAIPVLDAATAGDLLHTLMGSDRWRVPALAPRAPVARRRAIVRRTVLVLAAVAVPAFVLRPAGLALVALAGLGVLWGAAAHRRAGHGRSDQVVAFARGVLLHRVDLVPIDRVQSSRTRQSIFQRRAGVATILLDVAGSPRAPDLWDLELDVATALRREVPRAGVPVP